MDEFNPFPESLLSEPESEGNVISIKYQKFGQYPEIYDNELESPTFTVSNDFESDLDSFPKSSPIGFHQNNDENRIVAAFRKFQSILQYKQANKIEYPYECSFDSLHEPNIIPSINKAKNVKSEVTHRQRFSSTVRSTIFNWLEDHKDNPYPNPEQRKELLEKTGLTKKQLSTFLVNSRIRMLNFHKKGTKIANIESKQQ